jgi:hypothetical protein
MSTTETNGTANGKAKSKNEKLGIVPMDKLASVVPAKVWDAHRKNLTALAQAKEAAATSKAAVLAAMCKALKLPDPDSLTFHADAEKVVLVRRPKEKQARRATVLRDLTAA